MKPYGRSGREVANALRSGKLTVSVYGLGRMGLPIAAVVADAGGIVTGVDINEKVVKRVNCGGCHIPNEPGLAGIVARNHAAGRLNAAVGEAESDISIIMVPTEVCGRKPDLKAVRWASEKIGEVLERGDIVITECTMPPGQTESLIGVLEECGLRCGRDFGLAHCPERVMSGTAIRDLTEAYPKIIGGNDAKTIEALKGFYSVINSKGVIAMSSVRAAECVKVFEGIYRDTNIALANELSLVCEKQGVDALEVFRAANSQPYCRILQAGIGVGGHCLPYYPYFVMDADTRLIRAARQVNDSMPLHAVELLKGMLRTLRRKTVVVLGLSYRPGVGEIRHTPTKPLVDRLVKEGARVLVDDPVFSHEVMRNDGYEPVDIEDVRHLDGLVLATYHKEYHSLDFRKLKKRGLTAVVDGRNVLDGAMLRKLGIEYRGFGRK
ncbi:MAG: nucleotide sugar dehydrogenase [Candidatus Altiarchaeota archaeon]|nr:nucleotide sugar dehydrogenase [Candidatus Altiarchaeota archaeon]